MLNITNIKNYKNNLKLGDIIRCCNSKYPYVEGIVDFMLVKTFTDEDFPEGKLGIMVASGYKSGRISSFYPVEASCKNIMELDINWLRRNWNEWGYNDVDLGDVYIVNNKYEDLSLSIKKEKSSGVSLENYKHNLERGQVICLPKNNKKFMIVEPTFMPVNEFFLMPLIGSEIFIKNEDRFPHFFNNIKEPYSLDILTLRKKINLWLPNYLPKDILVCNSDEYPKNIEDLSLSYIL